MPKPLCRSCPAGDPLVGPILAVAAKVGGALAVVPRPSSRVDVEEEEGDEAEARLLQDGPVSTPVDGATRVCPWTIHR